MAKNWGGRIRANATAERYWSLALVYIVALGVDTHVFPSSRVSILCFVAPAAASKMWPARPASGAVFGAWAMVPGAG